MKVRVQKTDLKGIYTDVPPVNGLPKTEDGYFCTWDMVDAMADLGWVRNADFQAGAVFEVKRNG